MLIKRQFNLAYLLCLLTTSYLLVACEGNQSDAQPPQKSIQQIDYQSSVFRSVLDGKPRMLTVTQANDLKVAYDTANGGVYKIWQGELTLSGAVFDGRHGPQPESSGQLFFVAQEAPTDAIDYAGYVVQPTTGKGTLLHTAAQQPEAEIQQSMTLTIQGDELAFSQTFEVTGLNASQPIKLSANWLNETTQATGAGRLNKNTTDYELLLNNGKTTLVTRYQPIQHVTDQARKPEQHPGLVLISNSDCAACHNAEAKTVGPSYAQIAQRYPQTQDSKRILADKIIQGGAGNWGQVPMSAHPDLTPFDAQSMVDYIFTFAQESETKTSPLMLGQAAVDMPFSSDSIEHKQDTQGAYVYLAKWSVGEEPTLQSIRSAAPERMAITSQVHLPNADAFSPYREDLSLRIRSNLVLTEPLNTTLRLVSDDGSYLFINDQMIIDNWGFHSDTARDAEVELSAGVHPFEIVYMQGRGGASLSFQWLNPETGEFELVPANMLRVTKDSVAKVEVFDPTALRAIPGDQREVDGVHPAFDLVQARPDDFEPMVGGIGFMDDGRMVVSTWDPEGSVYLIENFRQQPDKIRVKRIAKGLAEPLGLTVVDNQIYVLQKQELTRLVDSDQDDYIDRYELVSNDWTTTSNFHEFAFGLVYQQGYFYAALATAIEPGGASTQPQASDRGKAIKINKQTGEVSVVAHGLRTPNGIGYGVDQALFIADNQGDWLPASKIVELTQDAFYGSRSVDFEGTAGLTETKPVVWLPQNEIGNSPSQPAPLNIGPYQNQMIHGEVTHGGLKRVFAERVNGRLQGAVFRFSQGLEAGVNRVAWVSDNELIVGGVGNPGNWSHSGKAWYGLQRLTYNGNSAFEMLSVSARSNGFEITFTEPVKIGQNLTAENFEFLQWRYEPTAEYGGPKLDLTELERVNFSLSEDRTKAQFELQGMKPDHLVYVRIKQPFVSENDHSLWSTEAWYTLNSIPEEMPVQINPDYQVLHNQLTDQEQQEGWELLFDGQSRQGLRNYNQQTLGERWVVDDNALHLSPQQKDQKGWQSDGGGDVVITRRAMDNYELYLEWKIQKNGNSGIIYNVKETEQLEFPFLSGPEFQILDNVGHSDGKIRTHRAGDNYDLIESRIVTVNPPGQWNRARLIVNQGQVEHWLNGYKVVDTQMFTPQWQALVGQSKFADWPDFAKSPGGHVVLQDHGDKVWFRNIKIKPLN